MLVISFCKPNYDAKSRVNYFLNSICEKLQAWYGPDCESCNCPFSFTDRCYECLRHKEQKFLPQ